MAHVIDQPTSNKETIAAGQQGVPAGSEAIHHHRVTDVDDSDDKTFFSWPPSPGLIIVVLFVIVLAGIGLYVSKTLLGPAPGAATTAAQGSATGQAQPTGPTLSATEAKEVATRDTYAVTIANELHQKVPAYKNVKIYADNWAGEKSPTRKPQSDPKTRVGDNLMLVFSSPESGTAKGLADFAKSKAAQEAANAGFAELQFVDPDRYCYALITPISGVGAVKCGPR